jgi:hypothetical protein
LIHRCKEDIDKGTKLADSQLVQALLKGLKSLRRDPQETGVAGESFKLELPVGIGMCGYYRHVFQGFQIHDYAGTYGVAVGAADLTGKDNILLNRRCWSLRRTGGAVLPGKVNGRLAPSLSNRKDGEV